MKIKILRLTLILFALVSVFIACETDENDAPIFVDADRGEQQIIDDAVILVYLNSHYYNSGFFETGSGYKYTDIIISELPFVNGVYEELPDAANNTLLIDAVETRTLNHLDADYKYYILNLNQGGGNSPKFTDYVRANYEGSSINENMGGGEEVFDSSVTPADFNLQTNFFDIQGVIKAWQLVMPEFNVASSFGIDDNGNVDFIDSGLGVMFVPSGLAYFSGLATGNSFDNLIFKFELVQLETVDHDNDGIPSYIEDLDGNLDVVNDDTDGNLRPNFVDSDDDGDDVLTIDELISPDPIIVNTNLDEEEPVLASNQFEISRSEIDGIVTIITVVIADSNNDGTPDYLDESITINYNDDM